MLRPGDEVTYVPDQNKSDNLHWPAKVIAIANRHNYFVIEAAMPEKTKTIRVHLKRLLVGQLDAFS